jgi:hypothetical protein
LIFLMSSLHIFIAEGTTRALSSQPFRPTRF